MGHDNSVKVSLKAPFLPLEMKTHTLDPSIKSGFRLLGHNIPSSSVERERYCHVQLSVLIQYF